MSRRRTLIANEIPNLQFETDIVDDEAEKRRRVSGTNEQLHFFLNQRITNKFWQNLVNYLILDDNWNSYKKIHFHYSTPNPNL